MKIKIIVNAIPLINIKTGIGRYIEGVYSELEKEKDLEIFYFNGSEVLKEFPLQSELKARGKLIDIFWKLPPKLALLYRLFSQYRREKAFKQNLCSFNIYHETSFFPFDSFIPTIFTIHDISLIKFPEYHPKERVLFFNKFFFERLKKVEIILTVSEFSKKEILSLIDFPEHKIFVTYLGYNKNIFKKYSRLETFETLKKFHIKKPYFLFVGTHDPRKNIDLIKKAAENSSYPVYVIGWTGWKKINENKNLITLGYVQDIELAHLLNEASALIYPSFYEGFGLPVLEAMACGCSVIVSKKASLPEVAGKAGIYLENLNEPTELIRIMDKIVKDKEFKIKMQKMSINQAEKFSWDNTAQKTLEAIYFTLNTRINGKSL